VLSTVIFFFFFVIAVDKTYSTCTALNLVITTEPATETTIEAGSTNEQTSSTSHHRTTHHSVRPTHTTEHHTTEHHTTQHHTTRTTTPRTTLPFNGGTTGALPTNHKGKLLENITSILACDLMEYKIVDKHCRNYCRYV
jgi:hypothetical protein